MLIDHSIGPVWEANHVWLIYILVIWWTGFPGAIAAAMTTLFIPVAAPITVTSYQAKWPVTERPTDAPAQTSLVQLRSRSSRTAV